MFLTIESSAFGDVICQASLLKRNSCYFLLLNRKLIKEKSIQDFSFRSVLEMNEEITDVRETEESALLSNKAECENPCC